MGDLLDDYEFQPTDTKEAKDEWKARARTHEATPLPCVVEFQECKVTEIDEDAVAPKLEGKWYPRGRPWTDEDLDAEVANVKKESPVPSDYKGVVYSGPSCLDDAWIQKFMDQQKEGILLPKAMAYELVIDTIKVLSKEKTMFDLFSESFRKLSLCHLISKKVFITHGGLP